MVCFGPTCTLSDFEEQDPEAALAAPLLEGWCDSQSSLGEAGESFGREVIRFTEREHLSRPETIKQAFKIIKQNPGCHLYGSLPCAPWSSWQRMNLARTNEAGRERVRRAREQSLEWAATFRRLAQSALARGGSVSFEWPRYCEGWKQPLIMNMMCDLDLHAVPVDGCATGLTDKNGVPLLKPWLIAVSSAALVEELKDFRFNKDHEHGKIAGDETAKMAYYPRALCEAIHRGLGAHERHRQADDIPAATAEAGICNPLTFSSAAVKVCKPDASNCNPSTLGTAAFNFYNLAGSNQTSVDSSSLFEPRHTSVSLAADDLAGPAEDSAPVTVRPLRAHYAGRRPTLEHDVCRDGEHKIEQALAAAAAWPYAHEPPPTVAEGHRQRLRQPPCGSLFAVVTRLIVNGFPGTKSAGCLAALKKERARWLPDASGMRAPSTNGRTFARTTRVPPSDRSSPSWARSTLNDEARIVFAGNNIQTASGVAPQKLLQEVHTIGSCGDGIRARDLRNRRSPRMKTHDAGRRSVWFCTPKYAFESD